MSTVAISADDEPSRSHHCDFRQSTATLAMVVTRIAT